MGLFTEDPQQLARLLPHLTPEQLRNVPHHVLWSARFHVPPEQQNLISPYEHRAYTKDMAYENPWLIPGIAALIPAYQGAKWLGSTDSRSKPSMAQMTEAYGGLWQGLMDRLKEIEMKKAITDSFKTKGTK
jgi:hypothetical protein